MKPATPRESYVRKAFRELRYYCHSRQWRKWIKREHSKALRRRPVEGLE